jgi:hypothetical protein
MSTPLPAFWVELDMRSGSPLYSDNTLFIRVRAHNEKAAIGVAYARLHSAGVEPERLTVRGSYPDLGPLPEKVIV